LLDILILFSLSRGDKESGVMDMKTVNKEAGNFITSDLLNTKATITNGTTTGTSLDSQDAIHECSGDDPVSCKDGICAVTWKPIRHAA
jgi:hypothetical protein